MALVGGGGSVRSREGKQRSEGEGGPESEGEVRGGSGRRVASPGHRGGARQAGREEVAGARGLRAPPSSFGVRGRKTTGGEAAVGWAAGGAGPGGLRGERQVRFLSSLLLFLFNSVFYLIATEFKFKQI